MVNSEHTFEFLGLCSIYMWTCSFFTLNASHTLLVTFFFYKKKKIYSEKTTCRPAATGKKDLVNSSHASVLKWRKTLTTSGKVRLSTYSLTWRRFGFLARQHKLATPRDSSSMWISWVKIMGELKDSPSDCRPHQSCSHPVSSHSPRLQKKKKGNARSHSPKAWMLEPSSRGSFVGVQSTKIRRDGKKKLPSPSLCANSCLVWFLFVPELT